MIRARGLDVAFCRNHLCSRRLSQNASANRGHDVREHALGSGEFALGCTEIRSGTLECVGRGALEPLKCGLGQ